MQAHEQETDHRGRMVRSDRQMSNQDTREYLREHCVAHVGTSDTYGWPYVVPLMYVYEEGDVLYLHTGPHRGHFLANVRKIPESASSSGKCRVMQDPGLREKKEWFFDNLLVRLKDSPSNYQKSYPPVIDRIRLYEVEMEIVTGKRNVVLGH